MIWKGIGIQVWPPGGDAPRAAPIGGTQAPADSMLLEFSVVLAISITPPKALAALQSALFAVADGMGEAAAQLHAAWQSFTSRVQLTVTKDTSLVWRETANEDLCLTVACGCCVAEYRQRRLAIAF